MASLKGSQRIRNDLQELSEYPIPGVQVDERTVSPDFKTWRIEIIGPEKSCFEGEKFVLQFQFSDNYPNDPPSVTFLEPNVPCHPQVFTNGHFYMEILDTVKKYWNPTFSIHNICMEIVLMLRSCKGKQPPKFNDMYVKKNLPKPDYKSMRM